MVAGVKARTRAARYTDWVQARRNALCFGSWGAGFLLAVWRIETHPDVIAVWDAFPRLFTGRWRPEAAVAWVCLVAGVGFRVWASGNLEKNRFSSPAGPYRLVRHPLYLGTLLVSLSFFLTIGLPAAGLALWALLLAAVFLPVLRKEERELAEKFPGSYDGYRREVGALVPGIRAIPAAIESDRFELALARRNFGLQALWFLAAVPALNLVLTALIWYRWHRGW